MNETNTTPATERLYFVRLMEWEFAAKKAGCTIEQRHYPGQWPMRFAAISAAEVEVGQFVCFPATSFAAQRGYLFPSEAAMLTTLPVDVHVKTKLPWGFSIRGKIGHYEGGYAVLHAETDEVLFHLPPDVKRLARDKPLYDDDGMRVTVAPDYSLE